jgi:chromosomal replication initiator protein
MDNGTGQQWARIQAILKAEVGEDAFNAWIRNITFKRIEDGTVLFSARTPFVRDWVRRHYADRIRDLWSREVKAIFGVTIAVEKGLPGRSPGAERAEGMEGLSAEALAQGHLTDSFGSVLDPRYTFESFVVGKSNELAYAAARRVAESHEVPFNPLFLHGGVGLGKTHLMHAIAAEVRRLHPNRRIMYMSAEKFMYQFVSAIRSKTTVEFKRQFRTVDLLMIDDVQFIANKDSTQEEFFHTFNALVDNRRQVVISADRSPTDLPGIEERIRSRLGWGLVADIHPTDYELRLGILQTKAENLTGATVPKEVLDFLAGKIISNVRELEGALNRVVAYAELTKQPVTIDMTRGVLQDLLRANDRKVTIDEILRQVSEYYNLRLSELLSPRRARDIARPRQVAMYLAKQLTSRSLPEIGRKFGGRDHTTVMHAVRKIDDLRRTDSVLEDDINRLAHLLEG